MKKIVLIVFISILLVACLSKVNSSDIQKINGYWEIEKVVFPDGKNKKYSINESFDYFEVKNNIGIREKVTPQLNGMFLVNDDFEKVEIKIEQEKYFIYYTTFFNKWKEEIKSISDDELVLVNNDGNEYHYKRANPVNLNDNGKEIK